MAIGMLVRTEGLPGPVIDEHVGEPGHLHAQVGHRTRLPFLLQVPAVSAADVDLEQRPGHGVKAGGEHDDVEVVVRGGGAQARRRDLGDRRLPQIHEGDVVPVESLEVVGVDRRALGAVRVVLGRQRLGRRSGSFTISRILLRMNSAAVSLAAMLDQQVVVRPVDELEAALLGPERS